MFARVITTLQHAMDTIAPPASPLHDFLYHWKMLMKFYDDKDITSKTAIEPTNIPDHLARLLEILLEEEAANIDATGPCLEYLLQHQLFDILVTLAITDIPPGMKQYVFLFTRKLVTFIKKPLVPYLAIYVPLKRLISICSGVRASPTESYEIAFLCALCAAIGKDPQFIHLFNDQASQCISKSTKRDVNKEPASSHDDPQFGAASSSEPKCNIQGQDNSEVLNNKMPKEECDQGGRLNVNVETGSTKFEKRSNIPRPNKKVSLIDALASFFHSADNRVMNKACEGIMVLTSLPNDAFARWVIQNSDLCMVLATRLNTLFGDIPLDLDPNDLDAVHVTWGFSVSDERTFPGYRQVAAFLGWLDYCDQLARESHPIIGSAIAKKIRTEFLEGVLQHALIQSKHNELLTTAVITKCLKKTSAPALLEESLKWLIGDQVEPYQRGVNTADMRQQLLDNCFHEQDGISLETLRLFEVILEKPCEFVISSLIAVYLNKRLYYNNTCPSDDPEFDPLNDVEEEEEWELAMEGLLLESAPGVVRSSRTLAPRNIYHIVNRFLSLIPPEFSSTTEPDEMGCGQYIQDTDRQYRNTLLRCRFYSWPIEASCPEACSPDSEPEADEKQFYEGPFLNMILTRLLNFPNQPFEISLQVSGLISRLALLPHPYVHEFILNPTISVLPNVTTVFTALEAVANTLLSEVEKLSNYNELFSTTRRRLLEDGVPAEHERDSVIESAIVLEEFSKELAAIAFVKYHHAS